MGWKTDTKKGKAEEYGWGWGGPLQEASQGGAQGPKQPPHSFPG